MFNIVFPANVATFFNLLIPVVSFDIIPSSYTTEVVMEFDYDQEEEQQNRLMHDQLVALGYDTHTSIINLGSLFIFLSIYITRLCIWLLFLTKDYFTGSSTKLVKTWKKSLFY